MGSEYHWSPASIADGATWTGGEWRTDAGGAEKGADGRGRAAAVIVRLAGEPERWALVVTAAEAVRVNGLDAAGGVRVLRHRDELVTCGKTQFFSTERVARVEPFAGTEGEILCGRCGVELFAGKGTVSCPDCRTLFHQDGTRSCWIYRDGCCPHCEYPATLDGHLHWTPEAL